MYVLHTKDGMEDEWFEGGDYTTGSLDYYYHLDGMDHRDYRDGDG